jgi:hypothetical protein
MIGQDRTCCTDRPAAITDVAKARGVASIAKCTGVTENLLQRMKSPKFATERAAVIFRSLRSAKASLAGSKERPSTDSWNIPISVSVDMRKNSPSGTQKCEPCRDSLKRKVFANRKTIATKLKRQRRERVQKTYANKKR